MSTRIGAIIDAVVDREDDEFSNREADAGGPTRWGVTQETLSSYRGKAVSVDDVRNLTRAEAWTILYAKFVKAPKLDRIAEISEPIGAELIDTGVNCGPGVAAAFLQRCLNALNLNGRKYPDIAVDADCGPATRAALKSFLAWRGAEGEHVLLTALNCLQGERYIHLAETRAHDEENIYGWLRARVAA